MFEGTGFSDLNFTLNLGDKFDTSNVTDMDSMFWYTGYHNNNLILDLSSFSFSNVNNYSNIFFGMNSSKKIYVKDVTDRDWIINNSGNSFLTTSNVLIKQ